VGGFASSIEPTGDQSDTFDGVWVVEELPG
jgi:hypothetical protein